MNQTEIIEAHPDLWAIVRRNGLLVLATTLIGLAMALAYTHLVEPKYKVTLTLVPSEDNAAAVQALGSSSGLSGLASLAGVNLPNSTNALSFELFPDAVVSRETADILARQPKLMQTAFKRYWDDDAGRWREPDGFLYKAVRSVREAMGYRLEPFSEPDGADLQEYLRKQVMVVKDRKRPVIEMAMDHADPAFAKDLMLQTVAITDTRLKNLILERSSKNIAYLSDRLSQTQNLEYRNFLYVAMSQEEKRRMSTSNGLPYVAEPFGKPVVPMDPVIPNVPLALALGMMAGLAFGLVLVLLRQREAVMAALVAILKDQ
jgi:hypothetical protein